VSFISTTTGIDGVLTGIGGMIEGFFIGRSAPGRHSAVKRGR
jgi:hypothetical protein